ncbi:hypothetical protein FAF44_48770 [Nonomuraea sp. MG754425]|uniref:hypothetical protein n=1 Tax=Nonomuraea sp. MG754425 TaxID=2570319 RepID=UPI001F3382B0|nr:hypothetical protein [Nonomuraea sp. MG754425]MCF6476184.1 hypothetical protein [Nonomuraea sp. MG754425]
MVENFEELPAPPSVRLIDFEEAKVVPGTVPHSFVLLVSGTKPGPGTEVRLSPLVYIRQPEFWGIEVVGSSPGVAPSTTAPYTVTLALDGVIGAEGVEVIGSTKKKTIKVP